MSIQLFLTLMMLDQETDSTLTKAETYYLPLKHLKTTNKIVLEAFITPSEESNQVTSKMFLKSWIKFLHTAIILEMSTTNFNNKMPI